MLISTKYFADLFFPKRCLGCSSWGGYFCNQCRWRLEYLEEDFCFYCKKKSFLGFTHEACKRRWGIDGVLSIFRYSKVIKKALTQGKYRGQFSIYRELFLSFSPSKLDKFAKFFRIEPKGFFQSVPIHSSRQRLRGFNQSELIVNFFQTLMPYPAISCLKRTRSTKPQAGLTTKRERYKNICGAFSLVDEKVRNLLHPVILVDDVITSGSTVGEATRILKQQRVANRVFVFSLAC